MPRESVSNPHTLWPENRPDRLHTLYAILRNAPPLIALVMGWSQLYQGRLFGVNRFGVVTFRLTHLVLLAALLAVWNLCFPGKLPARRITPRLRFVGSQFTSVLLASLACTLLLWAVRMVTPAGDLAAISLLVFLARCACFGIVCVLLVAAIYEAAYQLSTPRIYLIVGSRHRAVNIYKNIKAHREQRSTVLGFLDPDDSYALYLPCDYLGSVDKLESLLLTHTVHMVCLAIPIKSQYDTLEQVIWTCDRLGVDYSFATGMFQAEAPPSASESLGGADGSAGEPGKAMRKQDDLALCMVPANGVPQEDRGRQEELRQEKDRSSGRPDNLVAAEASSYK
jgi:hypothetical protein